MTFRTLFAALALSLAATLAHAAETIRIPDPNLLNHLLSLGYDLNDDGKIQTDEAAKVTELKLNGLGILNAQGLNKFPNLTFINLRDNRLTTIDLTGMTSLREILLGRNSIALVKVQPLPNLEELELANNPLNMAVDLTVFKNLKGFYGYNCGITRLNVRGLTKLVNLYVYTNDIPELDLAGMTALEDLRIDNNSLTRLDLTGLSSLRDVWAENNRIADFKTTGANALVFVKLARNQVASHDFTHAPNLQTINLADNPIASIDVRGLKNLRSLFCTNGFITHLNLSGTYSLRDLQW